MVSRRIPIRAPRRGRLTNNERCWLLYGYDERWADAFRDRADYEDAWRHHREELMQGHAPGRRPLGWWHLEAPCRFPGHSEERRVMFQHGWLEPAERVELIAEWREDFAKGRRWSDIPPELWAEWQSQQHRDEETADTPVPAA
jgi:hypothetical protein